MENDVNRVLISGHTYYDECIKTINEKNKKCSFCDKKIVSIDKLYL